MEKQVYNNVLAINIDVQNDFCPGGSLAVPHGDLVVPPLNEVNKWTRENGGDVIFTADWHPRKTNHFAEYGGPWPPHCIKYTAGAAFHDNLIVEEVDSVARKGMNGEDDGYSGWLALFTHDSPLYKPDFSRYDISINQVRDVAWDKTELRKKIPQKLAVVVGGLATDYCVKATVIDALKGGFHGRRPSENIGVFVVENAIAAVEVKPGDGEAAIKAMKDAGAKFVTSDQVINGEAFKLRK